MVVNGQTKTPDSSTILVLAVTKVAERGLIADNFRSPTVGNGFTDAVKFHLDDPTSL